jgi:hypothetical protein
LGFRISASISHFPRTRTRCREPSARTGREVDAAGTQTTGELTDRQAKRFLAAQGQSLRALFVTAVGTGMRQGDIDFEKGTLEVKRSLSWVEKGAIRKEPKSRARKRAIAIAFPSMVHAALRAAALKAGWIAAPVFYTWTRNYIDKKNVLRSFKNVVGKVNAAEKERTPI